MALRYDNRIPPFPATTLSTSHFRWLQESDWGDAERLYFASDRGTLAPVIFAPPPIFRDATKPHLRRVGRWVLNPFPENMAENVGWAEAQIIRSSFTTGFLFLGRPGSGEFAALEAWSLLISASFIQWSIDILRVVPVHMPLSSLVSLGGTTKKLWTPRLSDQSSPLEPLSILEFEQRPWWAGEFGKKSKSGLSYLQRRRSKYEEEQRCRCSS